MGKVLKVLFSIAFGIANTLAGGFVLSKYWAWFIVGKFGSAPVLNYLDCVGLLFVVHFFLMSTYMKLGQIEARLKKEGEDELTTGLFTAGTLLIIGYPLLLLAGYVWHQFIQ